MLQPKRTKFRKAFKGRIHGAAKGGTTLAFGEVGLKAMEPERLTARQIEAARPGKIGLQQSHVDQVVMLDPAAMLYQRQRAVIIRQSPQHPHQNQPEERVRAGAAQVVSVGSPVRQHQPRHLHI